ncbi:MAG TPA: EutN/CcmL family microcompartment protein [Bryobacteraceae bacterium]|nr:EutN/CcmL family microcompartment protein [Bryobacteraceae bacterium]
MRLGVVRGSVVLSLATPELTGLRLAIVEPIVRESLEKRGGHPGLPSSSLGGGKPLIAADQLGAAEGQVVAFIEGRTAASPFWPDKVPVDAYCTLIADTIEFHGAGDRPLPPAAGGTERRRSQSRKPNQ